MPIPKEFEDFLSGCRIVRDPMGGPSVPFNEGAVYYRHQVPTLHLAYPELELTLDSVLRVLSRELANAGCASGRDIALAALGLIVESRPSASTAAAWANACLKTTTSAELTQCVIQLNPCAPEDRVSFGEIELKPFAPQNLVYWADRAQVAYPIDLKSLSGRACLERKWASVGLIDWNALDGSIDRVAAKWGVAENALIFDEYFQAVFRFSFAQIPDLIAHHLLVAEAGALIDVDVESLTRSPLSTRLGLFRWRSNEAWRGWAIMGNFAVSHMNFTPPELYAKCLLWLKESIGFCGLDGNVLASGITSYCTFLRRAQKHRLAGRADDAFLHFVIALDLLLGAEGQTSQTIANRVATLSFRQSGRPMTDQVARVKNLYGKRSKYVHEGRPVGDEALSDVERLALDVLWSLLAASSHSDVRSLDDWHRRIDHVYASLTANVDVAEPHFAAIGAPAPGEARVAPNHIDNSWLSKFAKR